MCYVKFFTQVLCYILLCENRYFGSVFKQLFHGIPMAMKCTLLRELDDREGDNSVLDSVNYLEKNISELRIQIATAGSGVIVPVVFVRQQDQEENENGKWIAKNYNFFFWYSTFY